MLYQLLKYLSFLEVLVHNRLNLLCMKQIHASDSLFELLKHFGSQIVQDSFCEEVQIKLLDCLALSLRNDKSSNQLMVSTKQTKGLHYIYDYTHEFYNILYSGIENIFDEMHHSIFVHFHSSLRVIRQLVCANYKNFKA